MPAVKDCRHRYSEMRVAFSFTWIHHAYSIFNDIQ
jgi:hypothetical protein